MGRKHSTRKEAGPWEPDCVGFSDKNLYTKAVGQHRKSLLRGGEQGFPVGTVGLGPHRLAPKGIS